MRFYDEKNLNIRASACVNFTQDGSVLGYPQSGEWVDSSDQLSGSWYENGDELILSASSPSLGDTIFLL
jgi:hypothetical protein